MTMPLDIILQKLSVAYINVYKDGAFLGHLHSILLKNLLAIETQRQ
jgi:hypothetical protein